MTKWSSVGFSYFRRIDRVRPAIRNAYNLYEGYMLTSLHMAGRVYPDIAETRAVLPSMAVRVWVYQ